MVDYRITKYNPRYRDEVGRFLGSEWTSVSDLPANAEGLREYLAAENDYVKAICLFYHLVGSPQLQVVGLEKKENNVQLLPRSLLVESEALLSRMFFDVIGDVFQLDTVIRLALREVVWCKLELLPLFYIHFGYDFYVYVGGERAQIPSGVPASIFVEEMSSPYAED